MSLQPFEDVLAMFYLECYIGSTKLIEIIKMDTAI